MADYNADFNIQLPSVEATFDLNQPSYEATFEINTITAPSRTSELVNDSGFITKNVNDLVNYTKTSSLATVAFSGSYTDLSGRPVIPTRTSDLVNNSGYINVGTTGLIYYMLSDDVIQLMNNHNSSQVAHSDLRRLISNETNARAQADGILQGNIETEEASRIAADNALQGNIDTEEASRISADNTLQANISTEGVTRAGADTTLQGNINTEIQNRLAADNTLQDNITTEATTRANADSTLQDNLDEEEASRISADNTLQDNITTEAATRLANDNTLQGNITTEAQTRAQADVNLQNSITTINNTLSTYGNIVTHNVSEFATSAQGALADTALQPNDNITELVNNAGYITKAVNNLENYMLTADINTALGNKANSSDLTAEINNRTNADSTLQDEIDSVAEVVGTKVTKNADITGATKCKITYDNKGLVTAGADLAASDIPNLTLSKITDVTATASELNILKGATLTTTELNYVDGVTSNIQTQLNGKQPLLVSGDVTITKKVNPSSAVTESISVSVDGIESGNYSLAKAITGSTDGECTYGVAKLYGPSVTSGTSIDGTFNIAGMHQFTNANYLRTNEDNTTAPSGYNFFKTNSKTLQTVNIATKFNTGKLLVNDIKDDTNTYTYSLPTATGTIALTSDLTSKEDTSNKVTSITSSSTNTQYPSAKCVYDYHDSTKQDSLPTLESGKFLTNNGTSLSWEIVNALPAQSGQSGKFLTTNGTNASWANVPSEIFIAEYNVTTHAEILSAYNAGKVCYVNDGTRFVNLITINSTVARFFGILTAGSAVKVNVNSNNVWSTADLNLTLMNLTTNRVLVSDRSGYSSASDITTTELGYLDGVTSNIQTQLDNKVEKNNAITGATKCKITYDSKGLVTAGTDLIASDIPDISATYYLASNPSGYITNSYHDSTKYDASNPNGYTSNTGTITGITMNGSSKGTSGVIDLGTVLTAVPQATDSALGGIKASAKTSTETQEVKIDTSTGKLYVIPNPTKLSDLTDDTATNPIDKADTLTGLTATVTELNYTDGVTSNIQTQLDSKLSEQNEIVQNINAIPSTAITLTNNKGIYSKTISADTTFTFDVSQLGSLTNKAVTFEVYLTMATVYTLTFPNTITWIGEEPAFSDAGKYLLVFKSFDGGTSWLVNLEAYWE